MVQNPLSMKQGSSLNFKEDYHRLLRLSLPKALKPDEASKILQGHQNWCRPHGVQICSKLSIWPIIILFFPMRRIPFIFGSFWWHWRVFGFQSTKSKSCPLGTKPHNYGSLSTWLAYSRFCEASFRISSHSEVIWADFGIWLRKIHVAENLVQHPRLQVAKILRLVTTIYWTSGQALLATWRDVNRF